MIDRFVVRGVKKFFSLARTKIRLAREAGTVETKPAPLPLVKRFYGRNVLTIEEASECGEKLRKTVDFESDGQLASATLVLCDVIEGVKHEFEPAEYMPLVGVKELAKLEGEPVTVLLAAEPDDEGQFVFVGENPPAGVLHLSRVPSGIATFVEFALNSRYFSADGRIKNVSTALGKQTLFYDAIHHALTGYGATSKQ